MLLSATALYTAFAMKRGCEGLFFSQLVLSLQKRQNRLRLGIKKSKLFCSPLGLHYLYTQNLPDAKRVALNRRKNCADASHGL